MNREQTPLAPSCPNESRPAHATNCIGKRATILNAGIALVLAIADFAHAETAQERVALMMSGEDCPAQRQAVVQRLAQVAGVTRVDMNLIPDHVMIDRVPGNLSAEDLAAFVNELVAAGGHCRADVMKSCITAGVH